MITDIEIENFQGHINSSLSLDPGLNVIIGESDSGKSSIIRALTWVFKNRPKGDGFRNNGIKDVKKGIVSCSVAFNDDSWTIRKKGGGLNQYLIHDSDTPLNALRADLPEEVFNITKMEDVNIQSQHPKDQYFMLTESPGNVAKSFNKVSGLVVMDKALSEANKEANKTKKDCGYLNEEIKNKGEEIKNLSWIEDAEKDLDYLLSEQLKISKNNKDADNLEGLIEDYSYILNNLQVYKELDSAKEDLEVLVAQKKSIAELQEKYDYTDKAIAVLKLLDLKLSSTQLLENAKSDAVALNSLNLALDDLVSDRSKILNQIKLFKNVQKDIEIVEEEIKDTLKEWDAYKGKSCPLCGGDL